MNKKELLRKLISRKRKLKKNYKKDKIKIETYISQIEEIDKQIYKIMKGGQLWNH